MNADETWRCPNCGTTHDLSEYRPSGDGRCRSCPPEEAIDAQS